MTKVYAMSSDPYWSVNIKRGVVSMMNLDLNIENPVQADSIPSKAFMNVVSPDYNIMSAKSTYRVVEVGKLMTESSFTETTFRLCVLLCCTPSNCPTVVLIEGGSRIIFIRFSLVRGSVYFTLDGSGHARARTRTHSVYKRYGDNYK